MKASTTSRCETGSPWRPRCVSRRARVARQRHRARRWSSIRATTWPAPTDPIPSLLDGALGVPCSNCGDPDLLPDSATDVGALVARISGFATVSLQMRGTGCSGGAFDLFGYPSDYDAYDSIEVVAHQTVGRTSQGRHGGDQLLGSVATPVGRHGSTGIGGDRPDESHR